MDQGVCMLAFFDEENYVLSKPRCGNIAIFLKQVIDHVCAIRWFGNVSDFGRINNFIMFWYVLMMQFLKIKIRTFSVKSDQIWLD